MSKTVKDDRRYQCGVLGNVWARTRQGLVGTMVTVLCWGTGIKAYAQTGSQANSFTTKIVDLSDSTKRVTVPLNGSITIEASEEIVRADVITQAIADVQVLSPKRILITGRSYGSTSVVLLSADNQQSVFEISVELDLSRLNHEIRRLDPQSDASAVSMQGNIILMGRVSSADRAVRVTELASLFLPPPSNERTYVVQNHLDVAGEQQVLLRVVVAEINRSATRELGINGYLIGENFRDAFLVNQLGGINSVNIGAAAGALITENVPFLTGEDGLALGTRPNLSIGFPRVQMQTFIRALADNTLLRIMAEPNLVCISGETASFLAGGEFPIPVPQGNQQVTIEFREFGIRLNFTPVIRGHQRIRLRIAPEVSELDFSTAVQIEGFVVPGLTTRSTETTVELANGETIAIAGLLSERVRGLGSRVPGIGDLPIIGSLFRSVQFERAMTELVILVTPEIIAPLDAHQRAPLPGEDMESPDDLELYMLGYLEGLGSDGLPATVPGDAAAKLKPANPNQLALHGPWGPELAVDVR